MRLLEEETADICVEQEQIVDNITFDIHHDKKYVNDREYAIEAILNKFMVRDDELKVIMKIMLEEMEVGLKEEKSKSPLKMLPSYVKSVPNGTECGNFLALDLGGTNFRVLLITLDGHKSEMQSKIFHVPHDLMTGDGVALFDHIAACLAQFAHDVGLRGEKLPLGFTFSFPCSQQGLTSGRLINWTKGFKCSGVEGRDVVRLLQDAVHRRQDVDIDVVALLNDTVGTLMALAHLDHECQIGVIVGTGTNACYVEKISRCQKLGDEVIRESEEMIINTEWGAFGDNGRINFIRNVYDEILDGNSINPGKQIFEKTISGMYMGELVRLVLNDLHTRGLLFEGKNAEILSVPNKFPTKFISEVEMDSLDPEKSYHRTINIFTELGVEDVDVRDCGIVARVCSVVSERAAHLCAAGVAVLLNRMKKPKVTVGMDGSVYRFHPTFKILLENKIQQLIEPNLSFSLKLSEDGSGRGAALVAAVACRMEKERKLSR